MTQLKNIISTTEARRRIFELIKEIQKAGKSFTLTEKGQAKAVMISYDEYESIRETLELLQDDPRALEHIHESVEEFEAGSYDFFTPPSPNFAGNFAVAEKKGSYVPGSSTKKSPKTEK